MKQSKQELKYQARQQLIEKFKPQDSGSYNRCWPYAPVDVTQLLKKVVR